MLFVPTEEPMRANDKNKPRIGAKNPLWRLQQKVNFRLETPMSRIPIDLPPDSYPRRNKGNKGGGMLSLLIIFAAIFAVTYLVLEFL